MTAAEICAALVRIPTAAGHPTRPAIELCAELLRPAGFRVLQVMETAPGVAHGLLERPGEEPGLFLDGHLDTVPTGDREQWQADPLGGELIQGAVWGRGAADDKGPLAAALAALGGDYRRRVALSLTGDEETDMRGMRALAEHPAVGSAAWGLVLEPTSLVPVFTHKGNARVRVDVAGRAAHASRPWEGRSAIADKLRLLAAVEDWFAQEESGNRLPAYGEEPATLAVTREHTPNPAYNVIPDRASFWYNYRPLPGQGEPFARFADLVRREAARLGISAQVEVEFAVPPFYTDPEGGLVQALAQASGCAPRWVAYGTHAGYLAGQIPELAVFGPGGIECSHREDEHVSVTELEQAVAVLASLLASG